MSETRQPSGSQVVKSKLSAFEGGTKPGVRAIAVTPLTVADVVLRNLPVREVPEATHGSRLLILHEVGEP